MVMMESGFSSPRSEAFPAGLRVLVVDDDPTWLKILEKMLKKCSYEVTTCGLAREALKLLRDKKGGFDIVISDVNMPDMDGFKLLEHVGLEMDLPVIMMSVDGETSRVMKGVQHGACDYLLKPIRMKELKNIWQHVVRKRMHEVRDIDFIEDRNGSDPSNDGHFGGDHTLLRKRKDVDNKHDEKESSDPSSTKKARVVWTVELHQKFVKAVNQIGIDSDKVGPKKILDLMNVPWLTRENVASHLQKYRLYLSRIRKEDKSESSFVGMKNLDHFPVETTGSPTFQNQNSTFGQSKVVCNDCVYSGNQLSAQPIDPEPLDADQRGSTEKSKTFSSENADPINASTSTVGLNHDFASLENGIDFASYDPPVSARYPWPAKVPDMKFEPEFNPHPSLEHCFNQPTMPVLQQHVQADLLEPAPHMNPIPSVCEDDNLGLIDIKPLDVKPRGNDIRQLTPIESTLGSFSVSDPEAFGCVFDMPLDIKNQNSRQESTCINELAPLERSIQSFPLDAKCHLPNQQSLKPNFDAALNMNNDQSSNQCSIVAQGSATSLVTEQRSLSGNISAVSTVGDDLKFYWLQGGVGVSEDLRFDYVGFSDFNFPEHSSDVPVPKFGLNYDLFDCVDQGLLFS